jgi:hypothetical protein
LLTIGNFGVTRMTNNGHEHHANPDDYISGKASSERLEELWEYIFSKGNESLRIACEEWRGKPPSLWPQEVLVSVFAKGTLDLISDSRRSIAEMQKIIMELDKELKLLSGDREHILKQQIEFDKRRNDDNNTKS